jgi:hypothetical protein
MATSSEESFELNEIVNEHNDSDNRTIVILNNNVHSDNMSSERPGRLPGHLTSRGRLDISPRTSEETINPKGLPARMTSRQVPGLPEVSSRRWNRVSQGVGWMSQPKSSVVSGISSAQMSEFDSPKMKKADTASLASVAESLGGLKRQAKAVAKPSSPGGKKEGFQKKGVPQVEVKGTNDKERLDSLMSLFNSLSKEQIDRWKSFQATLQTLEQDPLATTNPNYRKILKNTKQTLAFLEQNKNLDGQRESLRESPAAYSIKEAPSRSQKSDAKSIDRAGLQLKVTLQKSQSSDQQREDGPRVSHPKSIDALDRSNISREPWVEVSKEVARKNGLKLLHDRCFQNSGPSVSRSVVFPKSPTDKSLRSECNLSARDEGTHTDLASSFVDARSNGFGGIFGMSALKVEPGSGSKKDQLLTPYSLIRLTTLEKGSDRQELSAKKLTDAMDWKAAAEVASLKEQVPHNPHLLLHKFSKPTVTAEELVDQVTAAILDLLLTDLIMSDQISRCTNRPSDEQDPLFKRNIQVLHAYLNNLSEFVIFNYLPEIKRALNRPFCLPIFTLLSSFYLENVCVPVSEPVLRLDYYLQFEERESDDPDLGDFDVENRQIVNKCFFDALSEALDGLRIFGLDGRMSQPIDWANCGQLTANAFDEIKSITAIEKACNQLLGWNDTLCGFFGREMAATGQMDEAYLSVLKEERMCRLIGQSLEEDIRRWKVTEREPIEVGVQLAELLVDHLLADAVAYLSQTST